MTTGRINQIASSSPTLSRTARGALGAVGVATGPLAGDSEGRRFPSKVRPLGTCAFEATCVCVERRRRRRAQIESGTRRRLSKRHGREPAAREARRNTPRGLFTFVEPQLETTSTQEPTEPNPADRIGDGLQTRGKRCRTRRSLDHILNPRGCWTPAFVARSSTQSVRPTSLKEGGSHVCAGRVQLVQFFSDPGDCSRGITFRTAYQCRTLPSGCTDAPFTRECDAEHRHHPTALASVATRLSAGTEGRAAFREETLFGTEHSDASTMQRSHRRTDSYRLSIVRPRDRDLVSAREALTPPSYSRRGRVEVGSR